LRRCAGPADPLLRLAALLPEGRRGRATSIALRLRLSGAEGYALAELLGDLDRIAWPAPPTGTPNLDPELDDASLRRFLATREGALTDDALREAWLAEARDGRDRTALRARIAASDWPRFPLQGRDALDLGATPGPEIGRILGDMRAWWMEGGCTATRDEALAELARRLDKAGGGTALGG